MEEDLEWMGFLPYTMLTIIAETSPTRLKYLFRSRTNSAGSVFGLIAKSTHVLESPLMKFPHRSLSHPDSIPSSRFSVER